MKLEEFKTFLIENLNLNKIKIDLTDEEIKSFFEYMNYILKVNENINLTAIKDPKEFIIKHIVDSIYIQKYIEIFKDEYAFDLEDMLESDQLSKLEKEKFENKPLKYLDIGTGGGFPLSAVNILNPDIDSYGLDSTNKKLKVIEDSNLKIKTIHGRAEMLAHDKNYRENFYIVSSRAVSNLNNIIQLMAGFVMPSGYLICMKGEKENFDDKLIEKFSLELSHIEEYTIDAAKRTIYIFKKINSLKDSLPNKNSKYYLKEKENNKSINKNKKNKNKKNRHKN